MLKAGQGRVLAKEGADGLLGLAIDHPDYPRGLLVVQDGRKRLPDGPQNFKLVDWRDVAQVLKLP